MDNAEKNVEDRKVPSCSFESKQKEPFSVRLKSLLAGRSINKAAKDWGVNVSTLKNYFSRQSSTPRHEVLLKISRCEGVSVDWLLYGDLIKLKEESIIKVQDTVCQEGELSESVLKLASMLDLLDKKEIEALFKVLVLKGVETALYLLDDDNIKLLKLDRVIKDKLLGKHYPEDDEQAALNDAKARECGFDNEGEEASVNLTDRRKQAV